MRQRKLLLPPFHGEAIERYTQAIAEATEREIDTWPLNEPFALAPRMQAITLDVIMAGIFGIEGRPERGTPEHRLRARTKTLVALSSKPIAQVAELMNVRREEPVGLHARRDRLHRPAHLRRDRRPPPRRRTSTSAATSSRCCCRRGPRRARS